MQQLEAAEKNIQQLQNDQLSCHANQMQLESEVAKLKQSIKWSFKHENAIGNI